MIHVRVQAMLVMLLLLAGAALAYVGRPTAYLSDSVGVPDLENLFPKQFGDWRVDAQMPMIQPEPDVQVRLQALYSRLLTRTYVNSADQRIMLSVAYGGDQSDANRAHRPEICYPAQGFNILSNQLDLLRLPGGGSLPVRRLLAVTGSRIEPITYWIVVGESVALSAMDQKLAQIRYGVRGLIADGMLVRVSSLDADMAHGHSVQAGFIDDLAGVTRGPARARIFGEQAR